MLLPRSYWLATRHPWPCLAVVLPALAGYEAGLAWMPASSPRTGMDDWVNWFLLRQGLQFPGGPSLLVAVVVVAWAWWHWTPRPRDVLAAWVGILVESTIYALGLWAAWAALMPTMDRWGLVVVPTPPRPVASDLFGLLGAGVFEETVFRLLLLPALIWWLRWILPTWLAVILAFLGSAVLFAAAHYPGVPMDPKDQRRFLFLTFTGLYFAVLFRFRGFGVAVGTHSCYNLLVGAGSA